MEVRTKLLHSLAVTTPTRGEELVRITTFVRRLLAVKQVRVEGVRLRGDEVEIDVRPAWRRPRCGGCGRRAAGYDRRPARRWRHVPWGASAVWLRYAPRRVQCRRCGVGTERVAWAGSTTTRFTAALEELGAYLATVMDQTAVTRLLGISWSAVGEIVERVVARKLDPKRLDGIRRIGVDEFSYRKRHRYLTLVVDHERQRVVFAAVGRGHEALERFFEALGAERLAQLELATIDMAGGYLKAFREQAPHVTIVFDRFHVQRLASDALDEVRRSLVRGAIDPEDAQRIKGTRYALLKNPWDLRREERERLSVVQRHNAPLYRAYLLKETLAQALDYLQPKRARDALEGWLGWASRSRLKPFVKAARTIRQHKDRILEYIRVRLTNGLPEGLNNKIRVITRRAYGFHSPEALIARIFLSCGGIELHPTLPKPT
jgi:transposase